MAFADFRGLPRRAAFDKVLCNNIVFNIAFKHLILLKLQYVMDINEELLRWFISFLMISLPRVVLKMKLYQNNNKQNNYKHKLLENLKNETNTHHK